MHQNYYVIRKLGFIVKKFLTILCFILLKKYEKVTEEVLKIKFFFNLEMDSSEGYLAAGILEYHSLTTFSAGLPFGVKPLCC